MNHIKLFEIHKLSFGVKSKPISVADPQNNGLQTMATTFNSRKCDKTYGDSGILDIQMAGNCH